MDYSKWDQWADDVSSSDDGESDKKGQTRDSAPTGLADSTQTYTPPKSLAPDGWEDLLGSNAIFKKDIVVGDGGRPAKGQRLTVHLSCRRQTDGFEVYDKKAYLGRVGEEDFVPGVDIALQLSQGGSTFKLRCISRHCYGTGGLPPHVPPNADLEFTVRICEMGEKRVPPDRMTTEARVSDAVNFTEKANKYFDLGNFSQAEKMYKKAVEFCDPDASTETKALLLPQFVRCHNNLALTNWKVGKIALCAEHCETVLEHDPDNAKALVWLCRVRVRQGQYESALELGQHAAKKHPDNNACTRQLKRVKTEIRSAHKKERALAKRFVTAKSRADNTPKPNSNSNPNPNHNPDSTANPDLDPDPNPNITVGNTTAANSTTESMKRSSYPEGEKAETVVANLVKTKMDSKNVNNETKDPIQETKRCMNICVALLAVTVSGWILFFR